MWIVLLVVVPFIIGMAGSVAQTLILGKGSRPDGKLSKAEVADLSNQGKKGKLKRLYHTTLPWHALVVGALIGLVGFGFGLPFPSVFGEEIAGCILAYTFSGGVSIVGYDTIVKTMKRFLENYQIPS